MQMAKVILSEIQRKDTNQLKDYIHNVNTFLF